MSEIRIEGVDKLAHGESRSFSFERDGETLEGFLLRVDDGYVAFANRCPHWNVDLDMGDGEFYSTRLGYILCRNHGALFEPLTGACVMGPCAGERLEQFRLELRGTTALVTT